jgi:hypothetical protein
LAFTVTTALSNQASGSTTATVALPATAAANDLGIVVHASDAGVTRSAWKSGTADWSEAKDVEFATSPNNKATIGIAYRVMTGGETNCVVTQTSERSSSIAILIAAGTWHGTQAPEFSTGAVGVSDSPDPDSVTASWGSENNLFIAVCAWDNSAAGNACTAYPTNYTGNNVQSDDVSSAGRCAIATREVASASGDPGVFTITSDEWWAGTIVVRPAAATNPTIVITEALSFAEALD